MKPWTEVSFSKNYHFCFSSHKTIAENSIRRTTTNMPGLCPVKVSPGNNNFFKKKVKIIWSPVV